MVSLGKGPGSEGEALKEERVMSKIAARGVVT